MHPQNYFVSKYAKAVRRPFFNTPSSQKIRAMLVSVVEIDEPGNYDTAPLRIIALRENGAVLRVRIDDFKPYFWLLLNARQFCDTEQVYATLHDEAHLQHRDIASIDSVDDVQDIHRELDVLNGTNQRAFRISFHSMQAFYRARRAVEDSEKLRHAVYEQRGVSYTLRFMVDVRLVCCGWFELSERHLRINTDDEFALNTWRNIRPLSGDTGIATLDEHAQLCDTIAPLRTLWFDIECVEPSGKFPRAETATVIMIGVLGVCRGRSEPLFHALLHLREIEGTEEEGAVIYHQCASETQLLLEFAALVNEFDADLVGGYNVGGFDFPFLFQRAEVLGCDERFNALLSRCPKRAAKLRATNFQSAAHGKRESFTVEMQGRVAYDLYEIIRRLYKKLSTYTLNAVSEEFLDDHKADVHHSMIPVLYERGARDRKRLGDYCLKDAILPYRIDENQMILLRYIELCRVTGVDMESLLHRGEQIKVVSQLLREGRERRFVLPLKRNVTRYEPDHYEGAMVLEPEVGFYGSDRPVMVLDFSSLYPSLMISRNFCYATYVPPNAVRKFDEHEIFKSAAGHCFLKREVREGVLPKLLRLLLERRGVAKKDMAAARASGDAQRAAVMNARQTALKLSANSIYGFTGVGMQSGGMLPLFQASESTTAEGRAALCASANFVRDNYPDSHIVYGDSVTGDTPLIVRYGGTRVCTKRIDELSDTFHSQWIQHHDVKQAAYFADNMQLEVLTETGWTRVNYVVKHKLGAETKLVRVHATCGFVDCTPQHSLVHANGVDCIAAEDVRKGETNLCTMKPTLLLQSVFVENGELQKIYGNEETLDALAHFMVFKCFGKKTKIENSDAIVFDALNDHGNLRVPYWLFALKHDHVRYFFVDCLEAKLKKRNLTLWAWMAAERRRSKELLMGLWLVCLYGTGCNLLERGDDGGGLPTPWALCHDIEYLEAAADGGDVVVYDLETQNHHFSSFGIVVHNTDSIFVRRDSITTVKDAWEFMNRLGPQITEALFSHMKPMKLAPEKVLSPLVSIAKKRYAGLLYDSPTRARTDAKMYYTGMEVVRRDSSKLLTNTLRTASELIFRAEDIDGALASVEKAVADLLQQRVSISDLVLTRNLSSDPLEYTNKQPHTELVLRMRERDADTAPQVGDRVMYVIVGGARGSKTFERGEDPLRVIEANMPYDTQYYLDQLRGPIERLLVPIVGEERCAALFTGAHTKRVVRKTPKPQAGMITSFFAVQKRCPLCKTVNKDGKVCGECQKRKQGQLQAERDDVSERRDKAQREFDEIYASCQRCQGSDEEVICMQRDCSQLYVRKEREQRLKRAIRDIEDLV